jgi:hypothetical protein
MFQRGAVKIYLIVEAICRLVLALPRPEGIPLGLGRQNEKLRFIIFHEVELRSTYALNRAWERKDSFFRLPQYVRNPYILIFFPTLFP